MSGGVNPGTLSQIRASGERVDIMHYHYTSSGTFNGRWEHVKEMYSDIMMADERVNFITVLRDSRSHFLSYYYYFIQPEVKVRRWGRERSRGGRGGDGVLERGVGVVMGP